MSSLNSKDTKELSDLCVTNCRGTDADKIVEIYCSQSRLCNEIGW